MLESINPDLVAHQGSPTKHPERAAGDDPRRPRAADPVHERHPRRHRRDRGRARRRARGAAGHGPPAGGHPPELRPAPVLLRAGAGRDRRRGGRAAVADRASGTRRRWTCPKWATPVTLDDLKRLIGEAKRLLPGVGIQVPPNLSEWWPELVAAGATDLGGLSANGDHISPEHPFPSPQAGARAAAGGRRRAGRAAVRLPAVHRRGVAVAARARRRRRALPDVQAAPAVTGAERSAPDTIEKAVAGHALTAGRADRPVRRDAPRGQSRTSARPRTSCAPELAGDEVTFVVNRNINVSNVCIGRLRVLRLRRRPPLARRLRARPRRVRRAACTTPSPTARPRSASSPASTPTGTSTTTSAGCGWPRRRRRSCTCTRTARWRSTTCARPRACRRETCSSGCARPGSGSVPGTAAEVLTTASASASPRTSCPPRAGWRSSRPRTTSACARP